MGAFRRLFDRAHDNTSRQAYDLSGAGVLILYAGGSHTLPTEALPTKPSPCLTCGACCSYSKDWPRFTTEDDTALDRIPPEFVSADLSGMRCNGDRCTALVGEIGKSTTCALYDIRPDVCRACQIARSCALIGCRGWFCDGLVPTSDTMRSASGNGRPLKSPPLTTQKTVVLNPIPRPSVTTDTRDSIGYLNSIRTPERRSVSS